MNWKKTPATFTGRAATGMRCSGVALQRFAATEGGVTVAVSVVPATVVTGCANLAAHQLTSVPNGLMAAAVVLGSGYLGVKGLAHKWSPAATWTFLGLSAVTADVTMSVVGHGWADMIAAGVFAAASFGGRLAYLHGTGERRAKLEERKAKARTEEAKAEVLASRASLTMLKAETERVTRELKLAQLAKTEEQPYQPSLVGHTAEETKFRMAVWDVFGAELVSYEQRPTRTGYTAVLGLPVKVPRSQARTQWDKIASALRANGRFVLSDGRLTNELEVKFLDPGMHHGTNMSWSQGLMPGDRSMMSLGINTETAEQVLIRFDERTLVCGASGTGKSWSVRPLMAHAHLNGWLVLIDGKGEEGNVWSDVARVANESEEILQVIQELHAEMNERKHAMKDAGLSVWNGDQLTAVIDEGQVVLALLSLLPGEERKQLLQQLIELSSLGRSRGVVLWWATQKPTMSGDSAGIHSMVAPNMLQRFSLRVADEQEARTALDDCAHYAPNLIPDGKDMRGHGYLKGYGPSLIQTWTMTDEDVRALPRKVWGTGGVKASGVGDGDKVARFFLERPDSSVRAASKALGITESAVRDARKRLNLA
jgi:hypothetical protein